MWPAKARPGMRNRGLMTRIDRYLLRQTMTAVLFVILVIASVIWITQTLRFVDYLVDDGAPFSLFLKIIVLAIPTFLGVIVPIGLFIGTLFTYNRLLQDSELHAMRAAGLGPMALARPALVLAGILALLLLMLNNVWAPAVHRELSFLQQIAQSQFTSSLLREGVFQQVSDNVTIYVRERDRSGSLRGILMHDFSNKQKPVTIMAEKGLLVTDDGQPRIMVYEGNRQEFDRQSGQANVLFFDRYTLDLGALRPDMRDRWPDSREVSTVDLLSPSAEAIKRDLSDRYRAEAHQRLSQPLLCFSMVLMALATLLAGDFNRKGNLKRVSAAALGAVVFQGSTIGVYKVVGLHPNLLLLDYVVALLPGIISLTMLLGGVKGIMASRLTSLRRKAAA